MLGAGTQEFMKDLYENQCFNKVGMSTVALTGEYLVSFVVAEVSFSNLVRCLEDVLGVPWGLHLRVLFHPLSP